MALNQGQQECETALAHIENRHAVRSGFNSTSTLFFSYRCPFVFLPCSFLCLGPALVGPKRCGAPPRLSRRSFECSFCDRMHSSPTKTLATTTRRLAPARPVLQQCSLEISVFIDILLKVFLSSMSLCFPRLNHRAFLNGTRTFAHWPCLFMTVNCP
jgi:hypothetical protein